MYPNLKLQIWKSGVRQNRLARMLQIDESMLSRIVNGYRQPSAHIRENLAALLDSDPAWLFEESEPGYLGGKERFGSGNEVPTRK